MKFKLAENLSLLRSEILTSRILNTPTETDYSPFAEATENASKISTDTLTQLKYR